MNDIRMNDWGGGVDKRIWQNKHRNDHSRGSTMEFWQVVLVRNCWKIVWATVPRRLIQETTEFENTREARVV